LEPFYYDRLEHAHGSAARFALEQLLVALEQLLVVASVVLRVLLHVAQTMASTACCSSSTTKPDTVIDTFWHRTTKGR
jgi:hypothetical protein